MGSQKISNEIERIKESEWNLYKRYRYCKSWKIL